MVTVQWPCGPTRRDIRARLRHGNVAMVEIHVVDGKRKYDMLEWNVTGQAVIGAVSVPWSSAACIQGSAKTRFGWLPELCTGIIRWHAIPVHARR